MEKNPDTEWKTQLPQQPGKNWEDLNGLNGAGYHTILPIAEIEHSRGISTLMILELFIWLELIEKIDIRNIIFKKLETEWALWVSLLRYAAFERKKKKRDTKKNKERET